MEITKIVITGGPCGGKTTAMSWIQNTFTARGYTVLFIPETATELISGGVAPWTCGSNAEYQRCQMQLQLAKEKVFEAAARTMPGEKVLIVCDRGALDNKAYMTEKEFSDTLSAVGINEIELRDHYDAVFHLVTAAKGAAEFYTRANNIARKEGPEEAAALDERVISAWTGHPHLRIIGNAGGFEQKLRHLMMEIAAFLGEPEPYRLARKFLIEYPDTQALLASPNCKRVQVIQTYLKSAEDEETRLLQRGIDGSYLYYETTTRMPAGLRWIEVERRLTKDAYLERLMDADPSRRVIRKDRYCLVDGNQYFKIDVYPFWNDRATVEIELIDPDAEIHFPDMLKLIREVTDEPEYKNGSLAEIVK